MTAPARPSRGPGFLDQVFGGGTPQSGDPATSGRAQNAALVSAGLTLASHRGPGALMASLGAGQRAYGDASAAAAQEADMQRQEQTRQLLQETLLESANDPESLITLARTVMSYGDTDGARAILEMAKVQASTKLGLRTQVMGDSKTGYKLINLDTGEVIKDYSPTEGAGFSRTPDEALDATMKLVTQYRQVVASQGMDIEPVFVKQLRSVTPLALQGDSQAQEAFFRALLRIQNPGLRRVSDDEVFAQADQQGLVNGKLAQALQQLAEGSLPASVIQNWLPTANQIIKDRIRLYDGQRHQYRSQAIEFGLNPNSIYDYFAEERFTNVPGVTPGSAETMERIWNTPTPPTRVP